MVSPPYNRAALYCRLSKDDEQSGESVSIETQRMMLMRYCKEKQFHIADYYIDDGFSGLSYDRPAFRRMIEDIEAGLLDIVITKDLSRLGRDYIMTGYLTDIYFSRMGVRYIAVNDDIDTQRDNNDIAPFRNIMNDMYAKDISRKIKSAKRQRAYRGMYIAAQPPYGYRVDSQNHRQLMVDHSAAAVIKIIFSKATEQKTLSAIARELTVMKISIPSVYKARQGDTRYAAYLDKNTEEQTRWNACTVAKILHDPVYCGHMVNHKYEVISYKTKERRRVAKDEQIIVKNTHEAIVDEQMFNHVQELLASRAHVHRHSFDNWLQDRVFCADCRNRMTLMIKTSKRSNRPVFRCIHSYKHPNECTGYRAYDYNCLVSMAYEKIAVTYSDSDSKPELTKTLLRQQVDSIFIGKRDKHGEQSVDIILRDRNNPRQRNKSLWNWY